MPSQEFNIYTQKGYAGDLVDSGPRTVQSGIDEVGGLDFGVPVARGTVATNGKFVVANTVGGNVFAITQREWNHEAANKPSDGTTKYVQGGSVSLIRQGYLYVLLTAGTSVAGTALYITPTGEFSAVSAGNFAASNVVADDSAVASGDGVVIKARIDIVA